MAAVAATPPGYVGVEIKFDTADMNADGIDDLVYVVSDNQGTMRLAAQRGGVAIAFLEAEAFLVPFGGFWVPPSLIDGDGERDVALGSPRWFRLPFVFLNDGTGSFLAPGGPLFAHDQSTQLGPYVAGDFNGDGFVDLLGRDAYAGLSPRVYWHIGAAAQNLTPTFTFLPTSITTISGFASTAQVVVSDPGGTQRGHFVGATATLGAPAALTSAPNHITNHNGQVFLEFLGGPTIGAFDVTLTLANQPPVVIPAENHHLIEIEAGDGQAVAANTAGASPLAVRVRAPSGAVTFGVPLIYFTSLDGGLTLSSPSAFADTQGFAAVTFVAGPAAGIHHVKADVFGVGQIAETTFTVIVTPFPLVTAVAGDGQATLRGEPFPAPLTASVVDAFGAAAAGVPVTFSVPSGAAVLAPEVVRTDALGRAATTATATSLRGAVTVRASAPQFGTVDFQLFVRGLEVESVGPTSIVSLEHEHAGCPILLMADDPLPAPGFIATAFGELWTSAAIPGTLLYGLDYFGLFGPAGPSMVTDAAGV